MIYVIWAPPRTGKTYFATSWAIDKMQKGKRVFSNYPIIWKNLTSYIWKPEYCMEYITDSLIIIDEAYRSYSSRDFKNFTTDEHTFFATNGHNKNDIVVIAQNPARVDKIIREMTNVFWYVQKFEIPFIGHPLWFKIEGYLSEEDFSMRFSNRAAVYSTERHLWNWKVAKSYDTHYFRKEEKPFEAVTWAKHLNFSFSDAPKPRGLPKFKLPELKIKLPSFHPGGRSGVKDPGPTPISYDLFEPKSRKKFNLKEWLFSPWEPPVFFAKVFMRLKLIKNSRNSDAKQRT